MNALAPIVADDRANPGEPRSALGAGRRRGRVLEGPRVVSTDVSPPLRATRRVTFEPGGVPATRRVRSWGFWIGSPWKATMTSPAFSPADAAGEPGTISATSAPRVPSSFAAWRASGV